jgi:hypothetical protein
MHRRLVSLAVSLTLPLASLAAEPAEPTETVVRMKVQPMAAPKPALKYQLLPELSEMNPGNPVLGYLKCFGDQNNFFFGEVPASERNRWLEMPLKDLPVDKLRHYGGWALRSADSAARLDTPDWQILLHLQRDGARALLPEVQQMRSLASCLKVRLRGEIADRRFDDAIVTAKTLLAMARHIDKHPTIVARMVGATVARVFALDPLEEMIQQPGCPNLYWALANLPDPLIDVQGAADGERSIFDRELSLIDETEPMTDAQLQKAIQLLVDLFPLVPGRWQGFSGQLDACVKDQARVDAARGRLTESGTSAEKTKQFPPAQVILLDEKRAYQSLRDDVLKYASLPYWQAEPMLAENQQKALNPKETLLAPLSKQVLAARMRLTLLDQRIALLRCVEALRIYAADHDGKLPVQLDDVPVPLPVDPVTGKAFSYKLDGATATLHGTPPRGKEKDTAYNRRYEVNIQK